MRALIVVLGLLLLVSGCTSDPAPPAAAPQPVKHTPAPRVADRDEKAVLGTLVNLDPCALAGADDARRRRPHLCIIDLPDESSVHIAVADRISHGGRYAGGTKEVGGAKVDGIFASTPHLCQAEVPVSFQYGINIDVLPNPGASGCAHRDEYAAKVVAGLGELGKVQHPANRPDLSKDACTVLTKAVTAVGTKLGPDQLHTRTNIDDCYGSSLYGGSANFAMLIEPGPPEGGWGTKWATVAGKTIYRDDDKCRWTWSAGSYSGETNRLITLSIDKCKGSDAAMKKLVGALVKELSAPQVPGTVSRLTYGPNEPDEPNPGACVDFPQDTCEPYQPTPLPADVNAGARADAHVTCTATLDAVRAQFPGMRPVVDTSRRPGCSYVQADHAVQLDFRVYGSPSSFVQAPSPRTITVAGHPGSYGEFRGEDMVPSTMVCFDTGKKDPKTEETYNWCVTATFQPPRNSKSKADRSSQTKLEPLMAAVAAHI